MNEFGSTEPPRTFDHYVAVDWSGARGPRLSGLSVARCAPGNGPPEIIAPLTGKYWTRLGIVGWLEYLARGARVLVGFDFSFSGPYVDRGEYFPRSGIGGDNVRALWKAVEEYSNCLGDSGATDLYAGDFCRQPSLAHFFLRPHNRGGLYEPRLRVTEHRCRDAGLGRAESLFHLIGPSQVGLGSLAGMRALQRLSSYAIWPFDSVTDEDVISVEIYTRLFLKMAGVGVTKIRDGETLDEALAVLGSKPFEAIGPLDHNDCDAIVAAAGLRLIAHQNDVWNPPLLSDYVRRTEGWTFGVP